MTMKLVTRADWGAAPFRQPNGAITYAQPRKGVKIHHLGESSTWEPEAHSDCAAKVRSVQKYHMQTNGWSDIGYSFLVCPHGYTFEGRGLRRRNSANGGTSLNESHYAVCALISDSGRQTPADAMLTGIRDTVDYIRKEGPSGNEIKGHRDGYATSCPGDKLYAWITKGARRPRAKQAEPKESDLKESEAKKPQGGSAPVSAPSAPAKPTTRPVAGKVYLVKKHDTLGGIAAQVKGVTWQRIYAANKNLIGSNPGLIIPGMKLKIPTAKAAAPKPYVAPAFPQGLAPNKRKPSARRWQRCLKQLGFMAGSVIESDNYGPLTQAATVRFHDAYPQFKAGRAREPEVGPKGWKFAHNKAFGGK